MDGYDGQDVVILDDWSLNKFDPHDFIRMADSTPYSRETKGGWVQFRAKLLVVLTNEDYTQPWAFRVPDMRAIDRRVCHKIETRIIRQTPGQVPTKIGWKVTKTGPPCSCTIAENNPCHGLGDNAVWDALVLLD